MIKWGKRGEIDELAAIVLAVILGVIVLIIGATVSSVGRSLASRQSRLVEAEGATSYLTPSRVHCLGQTLLDDAFRTRRFAARRYSRGASSSSLCEEVAKINSRLFRLLPTTSSQFNFLSLELTSCVAV